MFNKPFQEITLEDITDLVYKRKERENNHLEYKKEIGNSDGDKREFLKDISGFANAGGGFLIIGVEEKDGNPEKIEGINKSLGNQKIDEWINNVLISNIDEKLPYEIKVFELEDEKAVVLLHVSESYKKPHMVTFQRRNIYYVRHNVSTDPAIHSEVRDMFEYSKKNIDVFEDLLKRRNLFDETSENFGINDNSSKLTNDLIEIMEDLKRPFILYSFIPRYLQEQRINTISQEFLKWLTENSTGFQPATHAKLFDPYHQRVNLFGIVYPTISRQQAAPQELFRSYFEILNNGFFESGISREAFWYFRLQHEEIVVPLLHLTIAAGYSWLLLNFAQLFYKKMEYYDEVVFQISVVNVRDFILAGYGPKNKGERWTEPHEWYSSHEELPLCRDHERFKITEKFIVGELSDELIGKIVYDIAGNISRAFGQTAIKCFDDDRNFNKNGMVDFRRF